jgi:apolipoprotein N-acyltransferase
MAAALLIALPIYGGLRLRALDRELASAPEIRVGLLQPVLDPLVKDERFLDLLEETRAFVDGTRPDLMVWPEGMAPLPYIVADGVDPLAAIRRKHGGDLFDRVAVPIVIGGFGFWGPKERFSNTAAYILPSSAADRVRLYHKNKLLIFGERIPLEEHLPRWFRESVAVGTQKAGEGCPVMPLEAAGRPPARFRILICYEAVLQDYVRPLAEEREVDFLVNITEDLWYGRSLSSHTGQHESVLVLRAVENRMPIVRCTNAGPSEVIDAAGRRRERFEPFQRRLGVLGARIGGLGSVYKSGGHWFATLALGAGLGACCWRLFARRRSAAAESDARASQH